MTTIEEFPELAKRVRGLFQSTLDRREPVLARLPGILGLTNDTGSAEVTGKPGWVYVRIGNDQTVGTAFNNRTSKRNGLPVIVGYDPSQPTLFQVLSTREVYEGQMAGGGSVPAHHQQHEFGNTEGGEDLTYLRMRQMVDMMVYPTDPESLSVNVADGHYLIGATVYRYAGGTLDLTSYVPAASKKWVLIACDEDGPYVVDGTQGYYDYADIPDADDPTHYKLAGILLKGADTAITDWPNEARFVDLRLVGARSSASGGFVSWANVRIVAETGGNYNTILAALDASATDDHILIMPSSWYENISEPAHSLVISGLVDRYRSYAYSTELRGADDVGPLVALNRTTHLANITVIRTLAGGSGTYYGIQTADVASFYDISGVWMYLDPSATGRTVIGCQLASGGVDSSTITRCTFVVDNNTASGAVLELASGDAEVQQCVLKADTGEVALRITGSDTYTLDDCNIDGDVEITGAATVTFRNCQITGDVTIAGSGASIFTRNVYVGGDIAVGAGDTWSPYLTNQGAGKTVSGAGNVIPISFFADEGAYTDHYMGPDAIDQAIHLSLTPAGTVSGIDRASLAAFFTDAVNDAANYELVELLAFDDGVDIIGVLRTRAGGTGTLRDLWLGVGATKANYVQIDSSGNVTIPGTLTLPNTGLHLLDTGGDHDLIIAPGTDLGTDRTLTLTTGDADRTITLSGNPTLDDWFDQEVKVASSPTFAGVTLGNTGLHILDTNASHDLIIAPGSDLTDDRTLTLTTGDASRTVTLNGNPTLDDWFDQSVKVAASPTFAGVTLGNTGLHLLDTNASHDLIIAPGSDLAADRTLTITTGDADRTVTLSGNPTLADWFDQSVKVAASPTFANVNLPDGGKVILGTGSDGEIYSSSDDLYIANVTQDKDIYVQVDDGGVTKTMFQADASAFNAIFSSTLEVGNTGVAGDYKGLQLNHISNAGAGLYIKRSGNDPFVAFTGWDSGSARILYFGGGGWGVNDANRVTFWTDAGYAGSPNEALRRMTIWENGHVSVKDSAASSPAAKMEIEQEDTSGIIPVLELDQTDLSEEFINFISSVGAGYPIDTAAIGTYYGKIRVAVNGTFKYISLYNS